MSRTQVWNDDETEILLCLHHDNDNHDNHDHENNYNKETSKVDEENNIIWFLCEIELLDGNSVDSFEVNFVN